MLNIQILNEIHIPEKGGAGNLKYDVRVNEFISNEDAVLVGISYETIEGNEAKAGKDAKGEDKSKTGDNQSGNTGNTTLTNIETLESNKTITDMNAKEGNITKADDNQTGLTSNTTMTDSVITGNGTVVLQNVTSTTSTTQFSQDNSNSTQGNESQGLVHSQNGTSSLNSTSTTAATIAENENEGSIVELEAESATESDYIDMETVTEAVNTESPDYIEYDNEYSYYTESPDQFDNDLTTSIPETDLPDYDSDKLDSVNENEEPNNISDTQIEGIGILNNGTKIDGNVTSGTNNVSLSENSSSRSDTSEKDVVIVQSTNGEDNEKPIETKDKNGTETVVTIEAFVSEEDKFVKTPPPVRTTSTTTTTTPQPSSASPPDKIKEMFQNLNLTLFGDNNKNTTNLNNDNKTTIDFRIIDDTSLDLGFMIGNGSNPTTPSTVIDASIKTTTVQSPVSVLQKQNVTTVNGTIQAVPEISNKTETIDNKKSTDSSTGDQSNPSPGSSTTDLQETLKTPCLSGRLN